MLNFLAKEIGYIENNKENRQSFNIIEADIHVKDYKNVSESAKSENPETDTPLTIKDLKAKWTRNTTKYLIQKRLSKENDFQRPKCKKIKLWQDIAKDVSSTCDINLSAEECDNKYRNLLKTYKVNVLKKNTTGEGQITWEYFQQFDEALGCKASITPSKDMLFDSLNIVPSAGPSTPSSRIDVVDETIGDEAMFIPTDPTEHSTPNTTPRATLEETPRATPKKVSCKILKLNQYLYLKNKREEDKAMKDRDFKEKKWREEKELRQSEVTAILKLAEAISNSTAKKSEKTVTENNNTDIS